MPTCCPSPPPTVGQQLTSTCTVTNAATGALFDPTTVYAFSRAPSGIVTSLTVARASTGAYTAVFTPATPGRWIVRFSDSATPPAGSTFVIEQSFAVAALLY